MRRASIYRMMMCPLAESRRARPAHSHRVHHQHTFRVVIVGEVLVACLVGATSRAHVTEAERGWKKKKIHSAHSTTFVGECVAKLIMHMPMHIHTSSLCRHHHAACPRADSNCHASQCHQQYSCLDAIASLDLLKLGLLQKNEVSPLRQQ